MKIILRSIFLVLLNGMLTSAAGNEPPLTKNTIVRADPGQKLVVFSFDLEDAEEKEVKVTLRASKDNGVSFFTIEGAEGHVGYPVPTGTGRTIRWKYTIPDSDISDYVFQIVADDLQKIEVKELTRQVDSVRLKNLVSYIKGNRYYKSKKGLEHLQEVKDTIENTFKSSQLPVTKQSGVYRNYLGHNIMGKITGQHEPSKSYIVCAHFDCVKNSDGADDNASGVAGMLEIARILSQYNVSSSVNFIAFDLEEEGFLGSKQYVHHGGIGEGEQIEGVINFDMIAYYSNKPNSQHVPDDFDVLFPDVYQTLIKNDFKGDFVVNVANSKSDSLKMTFERCARKYVSELKVISLVAHGDGYYTPNLALSDHAVFWQANYRALHIGDGGESRNIYLNSSKDVMQNLNFTFMRNVVQATLATIAELAQVTHSTSSYCKLSQQRAKN